MMRKLSTAKNPEAGFTLVEIAIVMVIIGLLIGGIMKGQTMIENARIKRLVSDMDGMRAAVFTYQDRFGMLPGDENDPNTPNGDTYNNPAAPNGLFNEPDNRAIEDLRLAEILNGTGLTLPSHAFGGTLRVDYYNLSGARNYIMATVIPAEVCQSIDSKYDDGIWNTGEIRGNVAYTPGTNVGQFGWAL